MATSMPFKRGPFLTAAFVCEKILEEKDGVKSAIRIIDRVTRTATGPAPPTEMEPFNYDINLFISLKSGEQRGPLPLRITLVKPSGESLAPFEQTVVFEGEEDRGVSVIGKMIIKFDMPGIHWFHIHLKDVCLTQIPLRVIYVPQVRRIQGPSGGSPA